MAKKICIITGGNSGIGKQAAIKIAREGYQVILACRNEERGAKAVEEVIQLSGNESVECIRLDLSLRASTQEFARIIKERFSQVDVLIHNAAIFDISQKSPVMTEEGYETVWMTNHINPVYLTYALLDKLQASQEARVITVSSKGLLAMPFLKVDLVDPEYKQRKFSMTKAYYQSKRAQVMFTYHFAEAMKGTGITINSIRVPAVKIDLNRHPDISGFTKWLYKQKSKQSITPEAMAITYKYLATSSQVTGLTGQYMDENKAIISSSKYSKKSENIDLVMKLTKEYL